MVTGRLDTDIHRSDETLVRRLRSSSMCPPVASRPSQADNFGSGERSSTTITRPAGRSGSARSGSDAALGLQADPDRPG